MYMPLWGTALILLIALVALYSSAKLLLDLWVFRNTRLNPIGFFFVSLMLLTIVVLSVWLGTLAITFNMRH